VRSYLNTIKPSSGFNIFTTSTSYKEKSEPRTSVSVAQASATTILSKYSLPSKRTHPKSKPHAQVSPAFSLSVHRKL
jgi:hypothetical protein